MAVRRIHTLPDTVLRRKAKRVPAIDPSLQKLIEDMIETVHFANGVGLAAPQVGVPLRLCVLQMPEEEPVVLINPEIVKRSGERVVSEGCLSIPGYVGDIKRSVSVTVKGMDRQGKPVRLKGTELLAQVLEHELDHLNGILYIDHIEDQTHFHKIEPLPEGGEDKALEG